MGLHGSAKAWAAFRKKHPWRKPMECYEDRRNTLLLSGYTNYKEYLASQEWANIRAQILARDPICLLCDKAASQVHHLDYGVATLLGFRQHNLVSLCNGCHEWIEFRGKEKLDLRQANARLVAKARKSHRGRQWLEVHCRNRSRCAKRDEELSDALRRENDSKPYRAPKPHVPRPTKAELRAIESAKLNCSICKIRPVRRNKTVCRKCE